jgi:hypothetical protein
MQNKHLHFFKENNYDFLYKFLLMSMKKYEMFSCFMLIF